MDITIRHYLNVISKNPNKNNWRIRNMTSKINTLISEYRLEAMYNRGFIRDYCNKEANYLENQLRLALGNKRKPN
jgi:hypothetical protein